MEIIAVVSSLASGITQYMGAQQQAKAQRQAADSAIAMGKYNAQIDVNNMVAEQGDLKYIEAANSLKKNQILQKTTFERDDLEKKQRRELATARVGMGLEGTFDDVFRSAEIQGYNNLARFDFEAAQQTSQLSSEIADSGRQLGYSYQRGQANRDLTLRTAANNATQFRNQAKQTQLAGTANLFGSLGQTYTMGKDLKVFN
jgi:hypothetical protein